MGFQKGNIPWNKALSEKPIAYCAVCNRLLKPTQRYTCSIRCRNIYVDRNRVGIKLKFPPDYGKKVSERMKGRKLSLQHIRKISERMKKELAEGKRRNPTKGRSRTEEERHHISEGTRREFRKFLSHHPEFFSHLKRISRIPWDNHELRQKTVTNCMRAMHIKPNKKEQKLLGILERFGFEYVGDGKLVIDGLCPDFVNFKLHKIIELFGDYWHRRENPQRRIIFFKNRGYDALVIWEHSLDDPSIVSTIQKFVEVQDYVV